MNTIQQHIKTEITEKFPQELALGYLRYEALRRLKPREYAELCQKNLKGEWFDDLVDEEILKWKNDQ